MLDARLRTRLAPADLETRRGKVLGTADYDLLLTGAAQLAKPDNRPLCVYLPGVLAGELAAPGVYEILHGLRGEKTNNRGAASGSPRYKSGQTRSYSRQVASMIAGAVDPSGQQKYCRLTAWTGRHLPQWQALQPLLRAVAGHMAAQVPDRYAAQLAHAERTDPAWVVPGTPFTTITVNNSYATGTHTDKGDLDAGFSALACLRRGDYTGGQLVFPEYRAAVDMADGDLLLMDAHDWHGNVQLRCACGQAMNGPCQTCGAERISLVCYFRTKLTACGSPEEEYARGNAWHERVSEAQHARQVAGATSGEDRS